VVSNLRSCLKLVQIDYEIGDGEVWKMMRTSLNDWTHNLETIQTWSPYSNEEELFDQVCVLTIRESVTCMRPCSEEKNLSLW